MSIEDSSTGRCGARAQDRLPPLGRRVTRRHGLLALLTAIACRQSAEAPPATRTAAPAATPATPPRGPAAKHGPAALLAELASCELTHWVEFDACPAVERWRETLPLDHGAPEDPRTLAAREGLRDASPAVRFESVTALGTMLRKHQFDKKRNAPHAATIAALMHAARGEQRPEILPRLLDIIFDVGPDRDAVSDLMWARVEDTTGDVKAAALLHAAYAPNQSPERLRQLMKLVDEDPELSVRQAACVRLANNVSDPVAEFVAARVADPKVPPRLATSCFAGLVAMWSGRFGDARSQAAHDATIRLIRTRPSGDDAEWLREVDQLEDAIGRENPAPWYDAKALRTALLDLATTKRADFVARRAALVLVDLIGADKATIAALQRAFAKPDDDDERRLAEQAAAIQIDRAHPPR